MGPEVSLTTLTLASPVPDLQAQEKKTKLIDEDGLFSLIAASKPFAPKQDGEQQQPEQQQQQGAGAPGASPGTGGLAVGAVGRPMPALAAGSFFGGSAAGARGSGGAGSSGTALGRPPAAAPASGLGAQGEEEIWVDRAWEPYVSGRKAVHLARHTWALSEAAVRTATLCSPSLPARPFSPHCQCG